MNRLRSEVDATHTSLIATLRNISADILSRYVDSSGPFALLDFPNHANVGDSAIWLGEIAYFQTVLGSAPAYVCNKRYFDGDALNEAVPNGTLFLHGGGNFGDLWPGFQRFRERILARYPDRLVVQLPQTIHFSDSECLERTDRAIKAHGNFVLMVRDHRSFEIASSSFCCPVHLAPDSAFWIGALPRPVPATRPLLLLLREDRESAGLAHCPRSLYRRVRSWRIGWRRLERSIARRRSNSSDVCWRQVCADRGRPPFRG